MDAAPATDAPSSEQTEPPAVRHMTQHILEHLQRHRALIGKGAGGVSASSAPARPLFVGVQGPQGSGKTFLTSRVREQLIAKPHGLSVAVLSIDDLYLPHAGLVDLARRHPHNALLHGRGQPGTHDVPLGSTILERLRRINDSPLDGASHTQEVELPSFDKSLFNGEGDRVPSGMAVRPLVDVVMLEGWCVGFHPVSEGLVRRRWAEPVRGLEDSFNMQVYRVEDILEVNERLREYVRWWEQFDVFIQIKPPDSSPYAIIYKWRLQQEHHMKSRNGGKGMTDEQVKRFVDRYIPGYVFFGDGITEGTKLLYESSEEGSAPTWIGKSLAVTIGESRELLKVTPF